MKVEPWNPNTVKSPEAAHPVCARLNPAFAGASAGGKNSPLVLPSNATCSWPLSLA